MIDGIISATISSFVAGTRSLTVSGGGTLTLSGSGTTPFYSGATTVSGGSTLVFASPTAASRVTSTSFLVNGASTLVFNSIAREDLQGGTITFDPVGGGTVDFTGTPEPPPAHGLNGGVVLQGSLTIRASGGAQDRVVSTSGIGLNLNHRSLTLDTTTSADSLL
ncbi:MAG TPA: hypothetical protein VFT47_10425 [Vicinamibacterales bacterium]|nr:hypothetical protein [Vicinamibacterales bacterium]